MIFRNLLFCSAAMVVSASPAFANEAQVADRAAENSTARQTFTPADFERFAPRSALDMVEQIPGFQIRESGNDGERGLGQADANVIINGQRISGKSNGPTAALRRIPVEEVVLMEIVEGSSLDIAGLSGQVLNVITKTTGGVTGQYRYSAEWRSFGVPFRWGDGQISLAGGGEKTEWTLSLENDANRRGNQGIETVFDADDILIDTRDEKFNINSDRITLSGSFARSADNGNILNLVGEVQGLISNQKETSERTGAVSPVDRSRLFTEERDEIEFEVSADYAFDLGDGRLKLIGFHSLEEGPTRSEVITNFADNRPITGSVFAQDSKQGETIARGEYTFGAFGGDVQLALEGVKNFLEIDSTLEARDANGILQPVTFTGSNARVEEDRAETSVTYSRALSSDLSMQTSLGAEYSKISQSGAIGKTREFVRPKGFVTVDWRANDALNLSAKVERQVGQLSFSDFIASADINDGQVDVANANLVPPQSWRFDVEATQSLGDLGSINVRGFYEDISDIVDQIPIEGGGQAPGNIDSASQYGVEAEVTILFDPIGLPGLRIDAQGELAESEVLDPLTGIIRRDSDFRYAVLDIEFRKDFIGTDWAVGGAFRTSERSANVRLDEISQRTDRPGYGRLFIENKDVLGTTMRFRVGNLLDQKDNSFRTVYLDRVNDVVDFREERRRRFGTVYSFDIEGTF